MKIKQLASKPQLIKITLDSEAIIKEHGETIEFWTWDRQPMDVFMKLAAAGTDDPAALIAVMRTLILDEQGKPVIAGEATLPSQLLVAAMNAISEKMLGK